MNLVARLLAVLVVLGTSPSAWARSGAKDPDLHGKAVGVRRTGDLFLKPFVLELHGSRQRPLSLQNAARPLNPVAPRSMVSTRHQAGADAVNGLVLLPGERSGVDVILREQARAATASRLAAGLPGGRSFVMAETFGGTRGRRETVRGNARHELDEETGLDLDDFEVKTLAGDVAIAPDRLTGTATLLLLRARRPIRLVADEALADPTSGEVAEMGARTRRVPLARAIRYLQSGAIVDGRTALLLLQAALSEGVPLPRSLMRPPSARERRALLGDFDPERRDVDAETWSRVILTPGVGPAVGGEALTIRPYRFTIANAAGGAVSDRFEHQVIEAADQVSELPVVEAGGRIYVGLVPTVSPGIAARDTPLVAARIANRRGNVTHAVQLRGLIRDVRGYRPARRGGGNLGVAPDYDAGDAHEILARVGLHATGRTVNLGQFNASTGENGFHLNLVAREYRLAPGASLGATSAIRFLELGQALRHAHAHPREVDAMTQLQLHLLALRHGIGYAFQR